MSFTFNAAARALRHDPGKALIRRPDGDLPFLPTQATTGAPLLLDTCVYIDQVRGAAPRMLEDLLTVRIVNHSMVTVQELMHTIGVLDPADPRSKRAIKAIGTIVDGMPKHRLFTPDADTLATAAVHAGMLCRLQSYARDARMSALSDSVLFLQAMKHGFTVLTRNIRDFDFLLQMRPEGRVLFYRREE